MTALALSDDSFLASVDFMRVLACSVFGYPMRCWQQGPDCRCAHLIYADCAMLLLYAVQVIALVQRCLSASLDAAVKSLALHMLQRWKWQLAGHMQVGSGGTQVQ